MEKKNYKLLYIVKAVRKHAPLNFCGWLYIQGINAYFSYNYHYNYTVCITSTVTTTLLKSLLRLSPLLLGTPHNLGFNLGFNLGLLITVAHQ